MWLGAFAAPSEMRIQAPTMSHEASVPGSTHGSLRDGERIGDRASEVSYAVLSPVRPPYCSTHCLPRSAASSGVR